MQVVEETIRLPQQLDIRRSMQSGAAGRKENVQKTPLDKLGYGADVKLRCLRSGFGLIQAATAGPLPCCIDQSEC
jgi:hypothetical protein